MDDSTQTRQPDDPEAGRRRRAIAVAGIALLGIALAGLTTAVASAAWTDEAWFSSAATTGSADLEGSVDGTTWRDSNDEGAIELVLPAIADLRPGAEVEYPIQVRNIGTLPVDLAGETVGSGPLFAGADPVAAMLDGLPSSIGAGATAGATLRVTAPEWTGFAHMGETGEVRISIVGTVD